MTDAEYNSAFKCVKKCVERWHACCGLRWWQRITFHYCRTMDDFSRSSGAALADCQHCAGRTQVDWKYKHGDVYLNLPVLSELDDDAVDYVVRHEIAHILVNEMREWEHAEHGDVSIDHEERCVTELAQVLEWVRLAGRDDAKKAAKRKVPVKVRK